MIGPDYRKVIDLIRGKVTSGEWPVGAQIPSTPELRKLTGLSITSVRRAVEQLQKDGILIGHPGKGVFVKAMPEEADREQADAAALAAEFAGLRQELRDLEKVTASADVLARLGKLEARMGRLEAAVSTLARRSSLPDPFGDRHDDPEKAARRGRAG